MKRKKRKKNEIPTYIRNFCKEISDQDPIIVPLKPLPDAPIIECFNIVREHIELHGGKQINGWCIHVWRRVLIEAEFHCVWENTKGELIDLTPKKNEKESSIVFVPDPQKEYHRRQVDNIRKSLSIDPNAKKYIGLFEEIFRITNEGDLAEKHGEIKITDENHRELIEQTTEVENKLKKKFGKKRTLGTEF